MRLVSLVLALGMVAPQKARARARADGSNPRDPQPELKQRRRVQRRTGLLQYPPRRSPCGRHLVEIDGGAVFVDGRRVHPALGSVEVLSEPAWRGDGGALAWLERAAGETRLVVLPEVSSQTQPLAWPLPRALGSGRIFWTGPTRIVVGPEELQPLAIASWE
jgi:hypothetical protein